MRVQKLRSLPNSRTLQAMWLGALDCLVFVIKILLWFLGGVIAAEGAGRLRLYDSHRQAAWYAGEPNRRIRAGNGQGGARLCCSSMDY